MSQLHCHKIENEVLWLTLHDIWQSMFAPQQPSYLYRLLYLYRKHRNGGFTQLLAHLTFLTFPHILFYRVLRKHFQIKTLSRFNKVPANNASAFSMGLPGLPLQVHACFCFFLHYWVQDFIGPVRQVSPDCMRRIRRPTKCGPSVTYHVAH